MFDYTGIHTHSSRVNFSLWRFLALCLEVSSAWQMWATQLNFWICEHKPISVPLLTSVPWTAVRENSTILPYEGWPLWLGSICVWDSVETYHLLGIGGGVSPPHQVRKEKKKRHIVEAIVLSPIILSHPCFDLLFKAYSVYIILNLSFQFLRSQQIKKFEDKKLVHRQQQTQRKA